MLIKNDYRKKLLESPNSIYSLLALSPLLGFVSLLCTQFSISFNIKTDSESLQTLEWLQYLIKWTNHYLLSQFSAVGH